MSLLAYDNSLLPKSARDVCYYTAALKETQGIAVESYTGVQCDLPQCASACPKIR